MNWLLLCRMLGLLGMLVGGSMCFSLPWAFPECGETQYFEAKGFWGLVASIGFSLVLGGGLFFAGRKSAKSILRKEALAIVGLGWVLAGILGSLPYLFSGTKRAEGVPMTVADAVFESVSGFTTTGASVLTQLEAPKDGEDGPVKLVPRCILFWRCFTHWLGGMGIIVLFVAVLGQLGAGGKALMRREVPGPINEAVRPRVRETALVMWAIYVALTGVLALILMLEGLSFFDSLCHTFGAMATGGFSTFNKSVGHFDSILIELTLIVFMILAGTNFALFYLMLRGSREGKKGLRAHIAPLIKDPEFRSYLTILLVASLLLMAILRMTGVYATWGESLRHAAFNVVSIMTTTGFATEDFQLWPQFAKGLLLLLMFIGGCAGSTGGGMKVIRIVLFLKILRLEIEQAYRPNVVRPLQIFGTRVDGSLRHTVVVYFSLILFVFISSWMLLAAIEPDRQWIAERGDHRAEKLLDCASAVATTLNNVGPGLGVLGPHSNFAGFSAQGKVLLTLLMLLGRLELYAVLVLFIPSFWRTY